MNQLLNLLFALTVVAIKVIFIKWTLIYSSTKLSLINKSVEPNILALGQYLFLVINFLL